MQQTAGAMPQLAQQVEAYTVIGVSNTHPAVKIKVDVKLKIESTAAFWIFFIYFPPNKLNVSLLKQLSKNAADG